MSEIPFFEKLTNNLNYSDYDAFNHMLRSEDKNVEEFWANVDDAIVTLTLGKVKYISKHTQRFREEHEESTPKTFEFLRYDFILDENFNLYLMEVRLSDFLLSQRYS